MTTPANAPPPETPSATASGTGARATAGVLAPPPLFLIAVIVVAELLRWQFPAPLTTASGVWYRVLAIACVLTALLLAGSAMLTLRRARTPVEPWKPTRAIVTDGPYRWSRNPIYLAFVWLQAAHGFGRGDAWSLLLIPVTMGVLYMAVIVREERYLAQRFGEEYTRYRARTRRWA